MTNKRFIAVCATKKFTVKIQPPTGTYSQPFTIQ